MTDADSTTISTLTAEAERTGRTLYLVRRKNLAEFHPGDIVLGFTPARRKGATGLSPRPASVLVGRLEDITDNEGATA